MRVPRETGVVVIGGGAMGCSIAYHLAKEGLDVVLYEMRNIASGATGRCGGMIVQLYGREFNIEKTKERLALTRENRLMLERLQDELGDFEFRTNGCLDVCINEEEIEEAKRLVEIQKRLGDNEIQLLDRKETKEIMPSLTDNLLGSRYRPSDGSLNPFKLTYLLANAAKRHGALIFTQTKVEEIIEEDGRVKGVRTPFGMTGARWVVNATNGWASWLTKEVHITPLRLLAMATERVPELKCCSFEIPAPGYYAFGTTQTKSGNLVVGGPGPLERERFTKMEDYFDERVSLKEVATCANYLNVLMPTLRKLNIIRVWAGTMAFTQDGIPNIGFVPGKENLIIAAGFSAGMARQAVVGRIVTDLISRGETPFPMEIYDPVRFIGKQPDWPPHPYELGIICDYMFEKRKKGIQ